jgi:hypothetical protein
MQSKKAAAKERNLCTLKIPTTYLCIICCKEIYGNLIREKQASTKKEAKHCQPFPSSNGVEPLT